MAGLGILLIVLVGSLWKGTLEEGEELADPR